jgi:hypothetical protein
VTDRSFTPHELHQKAISVLDQLERIDADWRAGRVPRVAEIDIVTTAVTALRARIEESARGRHGRGPEALVQLEAARARVAEAIRIVDALTGAPAALPPSIRRTRTG